MTIESFIKEFDKCVEKSKMLKDKIEQEISQIDNLYTKISKEISNSFLIKHEKLTKEENELKEKLDNEVTKVKSQLEKFLSSSNNNLKISERIYKGIKILNKEAKEQKNIIKNLSYISKINKTEKAMKQLFQELMKNLKISFEEDKSLVKYDEFYFNGIPKPKNIEFKDLKTNSVNLTWEIDNLAIDNFDYKNIKYIINMRKETKPFTKVYEGKEKKCKIENLKINTNYEFKICSIYNDIISAWTEINRIKTKEIILDSNILKDSKKEIEFAKKILEWTGYKNIELLYRGTRDGESSNNFHSKCDKQGPTVTLCQSDKGYIFGGFCSIPWIGSGDYKSAPNSFLFTLSNIYGIGPTKFPLKNINDGKSIWDGYQYGPIFGGGHDLYILNNYFSNYVSCSFPYTYQDVLEKGKSIFTGNNNESKIKMKEIEIFKLNN